ncbi:MAG: amidohydrolase family protein, partial [Thaumarchaeota archaeon]|nr:amidohydrolase family protein [Nitrososphaerota archaeon]
MKNVSVLYGKDLDFITRTNVRVFGQLFGGISSNLKSNPKEQTHDCEGLLLIPGLINAHTHVGDSIAKDIGIEYEAEDKINPIVGFKQKILSNSESSHLESFIRNSCLSMIKKGITTFIDFREGGEKGIVLLKNAISDL